MTDNVIYGIDFRAGKEQAPITVTNESDWRFNMSTMAWEPRPDTAPSEYVSDSGDCA